MNIEKFEKNIPTGKILLEIDKDEDIVKTFTFYVVDSKLSKTEAFLNNEGKVRLDNEEEFLKDSTLSMAIVQDELAPLLKITRMLDKNGLDKDKNILTMLGFIGTLGKPFRRA